MIILGLIFLAAAVVAAVELVVANDNAQVAVHMWRWTWTVDAFWLAVAGAAILVVGVLGLVCLRAGGKRGRRLRRERRELRAENRQLAKQAENAEAAAPAQEPLTGDHSGPGWAASLGPRNTQSTPGYGPVEETRVAPTAAYPAEDRTGTETSAEARHLER